MLDAGKFVVYKCFFEASTSAYECGEGERRDALSIALKLKRRATEILDNSVRDTALTLKKARLSWPLEGASSYTSSSSGLRERLSSFSPVIWRAKPTEVSVLRFAAHGWNCVRTDLLHCDACDRYVDAALPSLISVSGSIFRSAVSRLNSMATEGHESTCRFRCVFPHDEPLPDRGDYRKRICARAERLEELNIRDVSVELLAPLSEDKCAKLGVTERKIATLACCGWTKSEKLSDAIECEYCGRTLGLWMFRDELALNAEREHRSWCQNVTLSNDCIPRWVMNLGVIAERETQKYADRVNVVHIFEKRLPIKFEVIAKCGRLGDAICKSTELDVSRIGDSPAK
ncbi:unnamed protein product [Toxocara canis]|uniref:NIPA-like protein n=1 Tax=Toxocara canis TaxID=6265 RepID=A0A3P7G959_TOXCA|nr:unnamed protein product [Toxocara canis]